MVASFFILIRSQTVAGVALGSLSGYCPRREVGKVKEPLYQHIYNVSASQFETRYRVVLVGRERNEANQRIHLADVAVCYQRCIAASLTNSTFGPT